VNGGLGLVVLADSAVWAGWSAVVGYGAHRLPPRVVARDNRLTRLRAWERSGRAYEAIGIRRWKDRLPEAGAVFGGGVSKRALPGRRVDDLERFAAETRRAELVHWAIPLITPVFALWNPPALFAAMVAYAVVANAPCIAIQRFNRARLTRVLDRRSQRAARR
jgi:glycosyl-4,4'-diaponeurosporenoate acyltransferase